VKNGDLFRSSPSSSFCLRKQSLGYTWHMRIAAANNQETELLLCADRAGENSASMLLGALLSVEYKNIQVER
jgi:hypothetical protein